MRTPAPSATRTVSPTPSIHAVPVEPVTRVSTTMPRSDAVLCSIPTHPLRNRKCTTNPSSAVIGRSTTWARDALSPAKSPKVARIWSMSCDPWAPSHPPPWDSSAHHAGTTDAASTRTGTCMIHVAIRGSPTRSSRTARASSGLPGVEAEFGAEEVHDAGPLGGGEDDAPLGHVAGEGLLAQDVPVGRDRFQGELGVGVGRGGDGDGVHAGERQRFGEGAARHGHLEHRGALGRLVGVPSHQAPDFEAGVTQGPHVAVAAEPGAHDHRSEGGAGRGCRRGHGAGHAAAARTERAVRAAAAAAARAPLDVQLVGEDLEAHRRPHADAAQGAEIADEVELALARAAARRCRVSSIMFSSARCRRVGELHGEDALGRQGAQVVGCGAGTGAVPGVDVEAAVGTVGAAHDLPRRGHVGDA